MSDSSYDALDYLGRQIVVRVRDAAMSDADQVMERKNRAPSRQDFLRKLARFSQEDIALIRELVRGEIDNTIHHMLWWLEQDENTSVNVMIDNQVIENVAEKSDGLTGEYEGKEGWMGRFSKYPVRH